MDSNFSDGTSSTELELTPRLATHDDLDFILEYAEKFWDMSPWNYVNFDETLVTNVAKSLIDNETSVFFVHGSGFIGGVIQPLYFGTDTVANELFWYADKGGLNLLRAFEDWAKHMGASRVLMSSLVYERDRIDKRIKTLYAKSGYSPIEIHYVKDIK